MVESDQFPIPLAFAPFFFRHRDALPFASSSTPGSALARIVADAERAYPIDKHDINPHWFFINKGEACIWARWVFPLEDRDFVFETNYWADQLERPEAIAAEILNLQYGSRLVIGSTEVGRFRSAMNRLSLIWSIMKREFCSAIGAGEIEIMARATLLGTLQPIPADAFRNYRITDWALGNAVGADGSSLFSIQIDPLGKSAPKRMLPDNHIAGIWEKYQGPGYNATAGRQVVMVLALNEPPVGKVVANARPRSDFDAAASKEGTRTIAVNGLTAADHSVEAEFLALLIRDMRASPDQRTRRKDDYMGEAADMGLSERAFNRLWSTAVRESGATAWSRGGAPKKDGGVKNSGE